MSTQRVIAFIQARLTSTRLPNKVLAKIGPWTVLELMLKRLERAKSLNEIVVLVPESNDNDRLAEYVENDLKRLCVRGDEHDVLSRFVKGSQIFPADYYVRLTADCPLICPEVVDDVVSMVIKEKGAYGSNTNPPTFPDGFDVECLSREALFWTHENIKDSHFREHVTYGFRTSEIRPKRFEIRNLSLSGESCDWMRLTVDTYNDLLTCGRLFDHFGEGLMQADHIALQDAYRQLNLKDINGFQTRNDGFNYVREQATN